MKRRVLTAIGIAAAAALLASVVGLVAGSSLEVLALLGPAGALLAGLWLWRRLAADTEFMATVRTWRENATPDAQFEQAWESSKYRKRRGKTKPGPDGEPVEPQMVERGGTWAVAALVTTVKYLWAEHRRTLLITVTAAVALLLIAVFAPGLSLVVRSPLLALGVAVMLLAVDVLAPTGPDDQAG